MGGRFAIAAHQNKADAFINALESHGYERVKTLPEADFYLTDWTFTYTKFAGDVCWARELGKPVFLYPHTARPGLWDFHAEQWPYTAANFVFAEGHAEVMRLCGYPCPVEVVGWSLTEIKEHQEADYKKRLKVLFAPIHPNQNGWLHDADKDINYRTFITLLAISAIDLTVRHIGKLSANNVYEASTVEYIEGKPDGSIDDILAADVVIGAYTFAAMAVALGKPTIVIGDALRPRQGQSDETTLFSLNWDMWKGYARFPFNFEDLIDDPVRAEATIKAVTFKNHAVEAWKRKFIGQPFEPDCFVRRLEQYL